MSVIPHKTLCRCTADNKIKVRLRSVVTIRHKI